MTDPVSVTFGVIGLTATALTAAEALKTFIDSIKNAPDAVKALSSDTKALAQALEALKVILDESQTRLTPAQARIVGLLEAPLENCRTAIHDIDTVLRPFISETKAGKNVTKWRILKSTFRQGELTLLQRTLTAYKQSLDIVVNVVSFSSITDTLGDVKQGVGHVKDQLRDLHDQIEENQLSDVNAHSEGSEASGTDYGFALKRFILETEFAMDELPSDMPAAPISGVLLEAPGPNQVKFTESLSTLLPEVPAPRGSKAFGQTTLKTPLGSNTIGKQRSLPVQEYWLPGYGLSKQIVLSQLRYFLGPSATVRPFTYHGREGYLINGIKLTRQQIDDLQAQSRAYERQQSMRTRGGALIDDPMPFNRQRVQLPVSDRTPPNLRAFQ